MGGGGEVFGEALEGFGVEGRRGRGGEHVGGGVLGEDFGEFVGLAIDEFFGLGFLGVEEFLLRLPNFRLRL